MALKTLKTETRGRVAIITLNRPDALNALNSELLASCARPWPSMARTRRSARSC
jgi:enoyl-CoA hydratase/carnithine racemase